jgi:hypothetical protein
VKRKQPVAAQEAAAEDGVGLALHDEVDELRELLGAVLQVGVLHHDDVAPGLGDPAAHRRALAAVAVLEQHPEAVLLREAGQQVAAAVGAGVVHRDQLLAQRHRHHALHHLLEGGALVVDRHHDGEERVLERRGPALAHEADPYPPGWASLQRKAVATMSSSFEWQRAEAQRPRRALRRGHQPRRVARAPRAHARGDRAAAHPLHGLHHLAHGGPVPVPRL